MAAVQALTFPNTSATVEFTGYDSKHNMAEFRKVAQNPKSPSGGRHQRDIQSVMSHATLWAHIHVNAADQIDVVQRMAY